MTKSKRDFSKMTIAERLAMYPDPDPERIKEVHERNRIETPLREAERRANAWPVYQPGTIVRVQIGGWRLLEARVVKDEGPASDGERVITCEKLLRDEQCKVKRDRVIFLREAA
jgi:hypothetical protein